MIRRISRPLLLALLLLTGAPIALDAQDTLHLSLDDAVATALQRSPSLRRATTSLRSAEGRLGIARGAYKPDLRMNVGPGVRYAPGASPSSASTGDPISGSLGASASSSVVVYDGGARTAAADASLDELSAAELVRLRTGQEVVLKTTTAFIDAVIARELIGIERENLTAETQQLDRVAAFVESGTRPESERYAQEASVAAAELRVLTAERNYAVATLQLALQLGLDPATPIDPIAPPIPRSAESLTIDRKLLARRPDLHALQNRIEAAERAVDLAASGTAPSIGMTGTLGTSYSTTAPGPAFGPQLARENPFASLGLTFTLPLLDRDRSDYETQLAQIDRDERRALLEDARRQVEADARQALLDYATSAKKLGVAERGAEASKLALESEEARYASGSSTLAELALARARYLSAASQRVQAAYELLQRRAGVQAVQGESSGTE